MRSLLNIFVISILFISCRHIKSQYPEDPLDYFDKQVKIRPDVVLNLERYGILKPNRILKDDSLLIVQNQDQDRFISVVNLHSGRKNDLIPLGSGPREVLSLTSLSRFGVSSVSAIDYQTGRFITVDLSRYDRLPENVVDFCQLNNKDRNLAMAVIGSSVFTVGFYKEGRYRIHDLKSGKSRTFLSYPGHPESKQMSGLLNSILYASNTLKLSPDGKKLACANLQGAILDICRVDQQHQRIDSVTRLVFYYPKADLSETGSVPVAYHRDNKLAFCDMDVSNTAIYALYSGKTFEEAGLKMEYADNLLVFDWQGRPKVMYKLKIPLTCITYDEKENAIYGVGYQPEAVLVRYRLNR